MSRTDGVRFYRVNPETESLRFRDRGGSDQPGNRHSDLRPQRSNPLISLRTTPLDSLHRRLGARMVSFAGWSLPVQFPAGTLAEHAQARRRAALFDVSHMGQISLHGTPAADLERVVPSDIQNLAQGRQRYTLFLNEAGGIIDDLMVAHHPGRFLLVLNAARTETGLSHLATNGIPYEHHEDRALLALQGPAAAAIMARLAPVAASLPFLGVTTCTLAGIPNIWISRSGYTGEDGFEISVIADHSETLAEKILAEPEAAPAGLAARDTLRLEAGLCLYGNDIDMLTSPIEAGLAWTIPRRRRNALDFIGAPVIHDHLTNGTTRQRVGIRPDGRTLARYGVEIAAPDNTLAGTITSGTFSPTLGAPIAMGYVRRDLAKDGKPLSLLVRGQRIGATQVPLPFVPHRFAAK
jgi:aminomethyltransferase